MSPELDTLDRLQGGDLPLKVIRQLYPEGQAFVQGVLGVPLLGAAFVGGNCMFQRIESRGDKP